MSPETTARDADEAEDLAVRTRAFVEAEVMPHEDAHDGDIAAAGGEDLRRTLQTAAAARGLLSPHAPTDLGGLGLGMVARAGIFEAAGRSLFGPLALNINAPDEGNVHMLDAIADAGQRERWLRPMVSGEIRTAFAMTEPPPGAGSDPTALATRATRVDGGWLLRGHKHFITGAEGAGVFIVMARTSGEPGEAGGATMFLVPADATGLHVGRHVPTTDRSMLGGHCEVHLDGVVVDDSDVLGEPDRGFAHAQVRLGPARMTHVMRWTGAAARAHEVAVGYAADRAAFGSRIADLGLAQQLIADNEIDLAATRALLHQACAALDAGERASHATSIAKTFAAEALGRVVDRATQLCGGMGVSADLPVARIAREMRAFRIYDGPSEVHRAAIAKRVVRAHRAGGHGV